MNEYAVIDNGLIVETFATENEAKAFALGYEKALGVLNETY